MDIEKKQEFTRRITQSNRSGLVVILYDMAETYLADAIHAHEEDDYDGFKQSVRLAERVIAELTDCLNFEYELAGQLFALYTFARKSLMRAIIQNSTAGISDAQKALRPLRAAFEQVAAQDDSKPLMQNTQQIYAGMTYGKDNLNESFQELETSRGFLA